MALVDPCRYCRPPGGGKEPEGRENLSDEELLLIMRGINEDEVQLVGHDGNH